MAISRKYLYATAAIIWGVPGCAISVKGFSAYIEQPPSKLWWLLSITIGVALFFYIIFNRVVNRYKQRIASLPNKTSIWYTFSPKGWLLLLFMSGLGVLLKHIPEVPTAFIASFYSALGPMLVLSAGKFINGFLSSTNCCQTIK